MTQYLINYDLGFVSRGLVGSIISLFLKSCSLWHLHLIISVFNLILIGLAVHIIVKILAKTSDEIRNIVFGIVLFFCVNPAGITYLFMRENFGRLELFSIIIMILSILMVVQLCIKRGIVISR